MSDIKLGDRRGLEGDRGPRGHRGEEGERGHRGHRGHDGETGPTGATGATGFAAGGLLKFSGVVAPALELAPVVSYLEDWGIGVGVGAIISTAPRYPVAVAHNLRNMATNLLPGFVTPIIPLGGAILIELLRNGVPVPGFSITYGPGESGVKSVLAGPAAFAIGDTFDMRATVSGTVAVDVDVSATVGVE